ncbi:Hypothetical predicted protein [Cloeon dipterum]|uniref:Uncharacterized protein n=1 Tax=Cloeon dipterum TaxID=197152 RepID=A0A8S1DKC7_9INSE|nr:Hypothetical predicted protein [Cloeon dipterum]
MRELLWRENQTLKNVQFFKLQEPRLDMHLPITNSQAGLEGTSRCRIDLAALGLPAPPEDMPEIDVLTIDMFSFGLISFPTLPKPTPHVDLYDKELGCVQRRRSFQKAEARVYGDDFGPSSGGEGVLALKSDASRCHKHPCAGNLVQNHALSVQLPSEATEKNLHKRNLKSLANVDSKAIISSSAMYSAVNRFIFKAAHQTYTVVLSCFDRINRLNCEPEVNRECVYCGVNFQINDSPLLPAEASRVPLLCPHHFSFGNPNREYLKEPQDPVFICENCSVDIRICSQFCHFTNGRTINRDHTYEICRRSMERAGRGCVLQIVTPSSADLSEYVAVEAESPNHLIFD